MLKKYISNTHACVSIILPNGKSAHISFAPKTGGGSVFYTEDKNIQDGLESHYRYGKLFRLEKSINNDSAKKKENAKTKKEDKPELKEVTVSCADDAKDYLSENFGVSRTKLKSLAAINKAAEANGIKFVGME